MDAAGVIGTAHDALAGISGLGVTATFADDDPLMTATVVIVSQAEPGPDAGLGPGMTDTRKTMRVSLKASDRPAGPDPDAKVTLPSPHNGTEWHVGPGSIERTEGDWRFELVEGPAAS